MSPRRFRRIDRKTAERLLSGQPVSGSDNLRELLAAAAAPPRAGELSGEQIAVAAFRAAHLTPARQQRRRPVLKSTLATLLTAKILVPAAAVAAVGGIATAAATGTLPLPGHAPADSPTISATHVPSPAPPGSEPASEAANPSPSLVGLCRAYTAGAGSEHGKALDSPAFTVLITAAGGKDQVPGYCADLLSDQPGNPSPGTPPTGTPETPRPAHPTGPPATPPASRPTQPPHPTGAPTTLPTH
jgi:hypothetical protein